MVAGNLRELLLEISNSYIAAKSQPFGNHPVANLIRRRSVELLRPIVEHVPGFEVVGSAGKGKWADIPWIVIYDKSETDGPQEGVYVAYLFSKDMQRVYLTFTQGVTRPKETDGSKIAFKKLRAKANMVMTNSPLPAPQFPDFRFDDKINLAKEGLGADYEKATIYYVEYCLNNLPDNAVLEKHLKDLLGYYEDYLLEDNVLTAGTTFKDVGNVEEGKRQLKQHYVAERKPAFIRALKEYAIAKFGELRCEVCGFVFAEHYGERGRTYIEGHHKNPVSKMPATGATTRPEDIALLCSNCHRMIHAEHPWLIVDELKVLFKK
jgi:5-methylcytosine-specific restriction protein A